MDVISYMTWSEPHLAPHSKRYTWGISGMTHKGPDFAPFRHRYEWQSRPGIAGRFCPADQAGARPIAATSNATAANSPKQRATQAWIKIFTVGAHARLDVQQAARCDTDDKATRLP
jgi:hypothetical protein